MTSPHGVPVFDLDPDTFGVDMSEVTRRALAEDIWQLEFDCDGEPVRWRGRARNADHAEQLARAALALDPRTAGLFANWDARLVIAVKGDAS